MNLSILRLPALAILVTILVLTGSGCRETTLINSNVIPKGDVLDLKADTLDCITHTYYNSSLFTSLNINGLDVVQAVGSAYDTVFGTMTGATFFNLVPQNFINGFDASMRIDSFFLTVPYAGYTYGDSADKTLTQDYQVYYIGDTLGYTTPYYASNDKPLGAALSAPVTVNLNSLKNDSVVVNGVKFAPGLRIKLKSDVIYSKLNSALQASYGAGDRTAAFVAAFNGVCVRPANTQKFTRAIPYFRLNGAAIMDKAEIVMYYHDSTGKKDSFEFFHAQGSCAHFNSLTKSYARFPIASYYTSTQANDSLVAVANQPGAAIDVKAYGLVSKLPPNVVINKASLEFSVIDDLNRSKFSIPPQLYLQGVGNGSFPLGVTAGAEYTIEDRKPYGSLTPYEIIDGKTHSITTGSKTITTYRLGLPREVISSIAAKNDTIHLHITGTQAYYGAFRLIAGGGSYSDERYRTRLIVVYSSLKN